MSTAMARRTAIRQSIVAHGDAYARIAVAELDFTAIQTAFDQGRTAYASLNYSQAVESYTQALDALYTNLTSILLHRAAAYEMQHIYERVLDDCDRADGYQSRSSSSGTPDVYFFRANAHVLQGDLKQGALVYRKGFETFPACTELGKKFNQLMAEMETRNKWLTFVLPYEIIAKILSMLTMKERIRFASTCRFWNEFIMREWHGMWQTIDTTKRDNMPRCSSTIPSFIRAIQPQQVRNLVLDMNDSLDEVEEYESEEDKEVTVYYRSKLILEAMLQGRWSKLESLEIRDPPRSKMCSILYNNAKTLKRLQLNTILSSSDFDEEVIADAVRMCPNIQSITSSARYPQFTPTKRTIATTLPPSSLYLTELCLDFKVPDETLTRTLQSAPHLNSLALGQMHYSCSKALRLAEDHCPHLRKLCYDPPGKNMDRYIATYSQRPQTTSTDRLQVLSIDVDGQRYDDNDQVLKRIFQKRHNTLETLSLCFRHLNGFSNDTHKALATFAALGAPRLLSLTIHINDWSQHFYSQEMAQLLASCPLINHADISGKFDIWSDDVFKALGNLDQLRTLSINLCDTDRFTNARIPIRSGTRGYVSLFGIDALFNGPAASSLTSLSVSFDISISDSTATVVRSNNTYYYDDGVDFVDYDDFLPRIARQIAAHKNITKLNLARFNTKIVNSRVLVDIMEALCDSHLQYLEIRTKCKIGGEQLKALASLVSMVHLKIHDSNAMFSKPKLYRLFEEHRGKLPFTVHIERNGRYNYLHGCKQYSGNSNDNSSSSKDQLLSEKYNIVGGRSRYIFGQREDKNDAVYHSTDEDDSDTEDDYFLMNL